MCALDNTSKEKRKKNDPLPSKPSSSREGCSQPPKRIGASQRACGAAYGAWLPIVKAVAYLTDFMVDRIFRLKPESPPRGSRTGGNWGHAWVMCAGVTGRRFVDIVRYVRLLLGPAGLYVAFDSIESSCIKNRDIFSSWYPVSQHPEIRIELKIKKSWDFDGNAYRWLRCLMRRHAVAQCDLYEWIAISRSDLRVKWWFSLNTALTNVRARADRSCIAVRSEIKHSALSYIAIGKTRWWEGTGGDQAGRRQRDCPSLAFRTFLQLKPSISTRRAHSPCPAIGPCDFRAYRDIHLNGINRDKLLANATISGEYVHPRLPCRADRECELVICFCRTNIVLYLAAAKRRI